MNHKDNGVTVGCYPRFGDVHFSRWRQVNSVYFFSISQKVHVSISCFPILSRALFLAFYLVCTHIDTGTFPFTSNFFVNISQVDRGNISAFFGTGTLNLQRAHVTRVDTGKQINTAGQNKTIV